MAVISDMITFETGGSVYISGRIWVYQDPDDPSVTPYAEISLIKICASSQSALSSMPSSVSIRLAGSSFSTTGLSWTSVYGSGSSYYRSGRFSSPYPRITLSNLSPGDTMYCSVSLYQSGFGTIQASGTTYLTRHVTVTPPATVRLNDVNYFTCTPFTLPDSSAISPYGYGNLKPSYKIAELYIDESTKFDASAKGRSVSGFYWYPASSLAQSGDFNNGVGEYGFTMSVSCRYTWYSGTYQGGGVSSYIIETDFSGGTIVYNETPSQAALPAVTLTASELSGSGLLARYGRYVKGKSQVKYTAAVTYKYGAKKSYFELTVGTAYTTALTYTFWPESNGTATAHAEDDHNGVKEVSASYSVYDYWSPQISVAIHRCNQDGTRNDSGSYCLIEWGVNVAPLGNQNSKSLTITHPEGTTTPTLSSYTASGALIVAADPEHSYNIGFALTDDFGTITRTLRLSTAGVIMDIFHGGHGVAFGKVAENDYTLEITSDWDVLLNTSNARKIKLVDALVALANAAGINIYVNNS